MLLYLFFLTYIFKIFFTFLSIFCYIQSIYTFHDQIFYSRFLATRQSFASLQQNWHMKLTRQCGRSCLTLSCLSQVKRRGIQLAKNFWRRCSFPIIQEPSTANSSDYKNKQTNKQITNRKAQAPSALTKIFIKAIKNSNL